MLDFAGWLDGVAVMLSCTQDEARMFVQPMMLYAHPEMTPAAIYTSGTFSDGQTHGRESQRRILEYFAASGLTNYEATLR